MAYNTMSVVRQPPYLISSNRGFIKNKKDEESQSSQQKNEDQEVNQHSQKKDVHQQLVDSKESHKQATESRDANLKNATINIAQIIKDFKNTAKAIGASPELTEEVDAYLALVERQASKETPDAKIVRSTLKNASILLDGYITETLQRQSSVVENWIDALFLQQINYKFNEEEVNPHFLVKFPNKQKEGSEENSSEQENQSEEDKEEAQEASKSNANVPQDEALKSLFLQAKKYSYANNSKKAMELFKTALDRAIEVKDKETESKVLFEIGKIYDKNDFLVQALTSYNRSLNATQDVNVKTKAHYSMAQIYDDIAQFEPAINHYMSSISYAGEIENLSAQSTSLTKIGNIYADEYKKEAFEFLLEADLLAKESSSSKTKGYVSGSIGNAYNRFNDPQNALKYYSNAVKDYQDAQSPLKVAINYKKAAEVMQDYNNITKAKALFKKALAKARQTEDVQLMKELHEAINAI